MRTTIRIASFLLIAFFGTSTLLNKVSAQGVSVNFQIFYDELSPYGTWVDNSDYGYVWVPDVAVGFTPYGTNGHWVFTDDGWTWFSDYPWGWAPFHYGRWYNDPIYGPMWVPGNEWGPGWVTWRRSEGYYGWAPIGPGISISMAYSSGYNVPHDQWRFVRDRDFGRTNISNYYVDNSTNVTIINNTTVINNSRVNKSRNVTYNAGPDRREVEKRVGKPINTVTIQERTKPGENIDKNKLQIYRPQVQNNAEQGKRPMPSRVANMKDVKTPDQRNVASPRENGVQPNKQQQEQPQRANPKQNNTQPDRQQPSPKQNSTQPDRQQPSPKQNNTLPSRPQTSPKQNSTQPDRQQPSPKQNNAQPDRQQPSPKQNSTQPDRQQPSPKQNNAQPDRQQPSPKQNNAQPGRQQQPSPRQNNAQPNRQQQSPNQYNAQPNKQQQAPQRNNVQPRQKSSQPKQGNSPQNKGEEKPPHK